MAVYTSLTDSEIDAFLRQGYALGSLISSRGILDGVENTNYLLTLKNAASGETNYILTLFEGRTDPEDLPFFLGLMQHLAERAIACPLPMPRRDGSLIGSLKNRPAALVSFLNGKSSDVIEETHCAAVGRALAQLHQAGADFPARRANALGLSGWQQLFDATSAQLDSIAPGLAALVAEELSYQASLGPALQSLPRGIIHADLFPDNVFFEGDCLSGLIDFYFACDDALAYDVAITLNAWCFESDGRFNQAKATALFTHYFSIRPFNELEKKYFPALVRAAALRFLLTRAYDLLNPKPDAVVTAKNPLEYVAKLDFHRQMTAFVEYGL